MGGRRRPWVWAAVGLGLLLMIGAVRGIVAMGGIKSVALVPDPSGGAGLSAGPIEESGLVGGKPRRIAVVGIWGELPHVQHRALFAPSTLAHSAFGRHQAVGEFERQAALLGPRWAFRWHRPRAGKDRIEAMDTRQAGARRGGQQVVLAAAGVLLLVGALIALPAVRDTARVRVMTAPASRAGLTGGPICLSSVGGRGRPRTVATLGHWVRIGTLEIGFYSRRPHWLIPRPR